MSSQMTIKSKYEILVDIIDSICNAAPDSFSSYQLTNKNEEEKNSIRSKAYIHLYLLVKFGVQDFKTRHDLITDGPHDGGIDAYYIDQVGKVIYLIQSKYRASEENYEAKEIDPAEIALMEVKNILAGGSIGTDGQPYNGKIIGMQKKISSLSNVALYDQKIILLANLYSKKNLKITETILAGLSYEVFDYQKAYDELLFPYCVSTYFQNDHIVIDKNIVGITKFYTEEFNNTSYGKCNVTMMFVPLSFIAEIVDEYKNSILRYNPRNYLSMSKNAVNKTISTGLQSQNEDFALLNNGITMICTNFKATSQNGLKDSTNVHIIDPQIINGGQTSFTLSRLLYTNPEYIKNKRVLLKVIATFQDEKENAENGSEKKNELQNQYQTFINSISDATNMQTKIEEADRRANLPIQYDLQKRLFTYYGLLYERKKGEFEEAIHSKVITSSQILQRDVLVRSLMAINGECDKAMSQSKDDLFEKSNFERVVNDTLMCHQVVYAYILYSMAAQKDKDNKKKPHKIWGNGTRYGKYAVISAFGMLSKGKINPKDSIGDIKAFSEKSIEAILKEWGNFEKWANKKEENKTYFRKEANYANYYKSQNARKDVQEYWSKYTLNDQVELVLTKTNAQ